MSELTNFLSGIRENVNNISLDKDKLENLERILDVLVSHAKSYGEEISSASSEMYNQSDSDLPTWQRVFYFIGKTDIAINWAVGSWVNPNWREPLPSRIVLGPAFRSEFRGHPDLYAWRVSVADLATAVPAGAMTVTKYISKRVAASLADLGVTVALGLGIDYATGLNRSADEIDDGGSYNVMFYLSDYKLADAGYKYVANTFPYEFVR